MQRKIAATTFCLILFPVIASAQINCNGLSAAQCRMVTIVGTDAICGLGGTGYIVEEGQVKINGIIIGHVDDLGNIVDDDGEIITELTKIYIQTCRNEY